MSTTAVGPRLRIDGPSPRPRPHSLLETPGVVVSRDDTRWINGVAIEGYPSAVPSLWEPCSDGTFRVKDEGDGLPFAGFDPIAQYLPISCSSIGLRDPEAVLADKATATLEVVLSHGVEQQLAEGVLLSGNPFFGDANVDILASGSAVTPRVGISYLEEAGGLSGRGVMIHVTPAIAAALQPVVADIENGLFTANGTPIVAGSGYQDVETSWLSTPDDTEDWAFVTGPVEVRIGPEVITTTAESLDRETNDLVFRAERYVVAYWDTVVQAAVLIDWAS